MPLLLFGYQLVQHDLWLTTSDWVISQDGTRLWTIRYRSGSSAPYTLQLWDITQKRLINSRATGGIWLTLSPDEERLVTTSGGGGWQVVDADTLAPIHTTATSPWWVVTYLDRQHLLAITHQAGGGVDVLEEVGGRVAASLPPAGPTASPNAEASRDAKTFAVSFFGGPGRDTPWTIYRYESGRLVKLEELEGSIAGGPFAISPDGSYVAATDRRAGNADMLLAVRRIGEEEPLWSRTLDNVIDLTFLSRSDVLVSAHQDGTVRLWDVATGNSLNQWRVDRWILLGKSWEALDHNLVVEGEWWRGTARRFPISGGPVVIRDIRTGQLVMQLPMSERRYVAYLAAVCLGILIWSVIWVASGVKSKRPYPLLEIAVAHLVLLALALARMLLPETGSDVRRPAAWLLLGQAAGLTCAAVIYLVLSRWGWALRIAAGIAFLAIATAVMLSVWKDEATMWHIVIGATVLITLLVAALLLLRRQGYQLEWRRTAQPRHEQSYSQFTLRDMMILAGALGGFFAAARFFVPDVVPLWLLEFIALEGISYALIALLGLWAVFGPQPASLRWSLFAALAAGSFLIPWATFYNSPVLPWWWYFATHTLAAVHLAWTLVALRAYGYGLVRKTSL